MAVVILRAPLSELAGGKRCTVDGATVAEGLAALEGERPALRGGCSTSTAASGATSTSTSTVS